MANENLSEAEIKKRLKARGKGELIKIIINLSATIDAHKAHKQEIVEKIEDVSKNNGFVMHADYCNLLDMAKGEDSGKE